MKIESGSPPGEIRYWLIVTILLVGYGGYFYYDGLYGYYAKNASEARKNPVLAGKESVTANLQNDRKPTISELQRVRALRPATTSEVRRELGEPEIVETNSSQQTVERYVSVYGMGTVISVDGRVVEPDGIQLNDWGKDEDEINAQFYWGLIPLLLAIYPIRRLIMALTLRVTLDDEALVYGKNRIPLAAVTDFKGYNPKGWVDLHFEMDGEERKLRLDNQRVKHFDEIIAEISAARGLVNPIAAHQAAREAEAAS